MGRLIGRLAALAGVALSLAVVSAAPAAACSCTPITDSDAFAAADAVFVGTLERDYEPREAGGTGVAVALFTVDAVYKGSVTEQQAVATPGDSAACGLTFEPATEYLVFASADAGLLDDDLEPGFYAVQLCGGTRVLVDQPLGFDAAEQLPDLGGPSETDIQDQLGSPRTSLFPEVLIFFGVIALVLGIASWHSLKRSRRAAAG